MYIILGILISTNTITHNNNTWLYGVKIPILIEQLLIMFQLLMLGLFFIEILKKSLFAKRVRLLFILSMLSYAILIVVVFSTNVEIRPIIVSHICLFIFCLFYLKDLMKNKPTLLLIKSSTFWITMGIFYSSCIGFPLNSLIPFFPKSEEYLNLRFQIFSIYNMSLIILYIFIIKSYLCLKHQQNL
jgi:hypothetical protein